MQKFSGGETPGPPLGEGASNTGAVSNAAGRGSFTGASAAGRGASTGASVAGNWNKPIVKAAKRAQVNLPLKLIGACYF